MAPSTLANVLWINLDRRTDRAERQQQRLETAGLEDFSERVSAVDGSEVDFSTVPSEVLTRAGRRQAQHAPDFVLGRVLTPGAIGLWLSWYEVMYRIIEEAAPEECYLVLEDDAEYTDHLGIEIFRVLEALDAWDAQWHACAVGFIRSKSRSQALPGEEVLRAPTKLCGATAILVHGATGAHEMLLNLFPVDADQQFDLKITLMLHDPQSTMRFYCSATPLCTAPLSEAGDTDIQRIPVEKQVSMREEATRRHDMGDLIKSSTPASVTSKSHNAEAADTESQRVTVKKQVSLIEEATRRHDMGDLSKSSSSANVPLRTSKSHNAEAADTDVQRVPVEKQVSVREEATRRRDKGSSPASVPLRTKLARGEGPEHSCHSLLRLGTWPPRRPARPAGAASAASAAAAAALSEQELALEQLRRLDKGVPELRKLHGELALKTQQLRASRGNRQLEQEHQNLQRQLEEAVEARDHILHHALPYQRRACKTSRKALLLRHVPNGDSPQRALRHFGRGRRKVMIFGPYHTCTNAMAKELERHFDVEILNDWHTNKADPLWKHRANHRQPQGLTPDVFCVLMVKEPHFWLQSCSRELRSFFEIRPVGPQRRELPAQELWQLLGGIEHDGILYENAMDLWNDTIHSYLDDTIYPPEQAVVVRCEDFLFSFHRVMESLSSLGALTQTAPLEPMAERAKGHKECRTRDEALAFYGNARNQKSAFTSDQLTLIAYALDASAMSQLGYNQADVVQQWSA